MESLSDRIKKLLASDQLGVAIEKMLVRAENTDQEVDLIGLKRRYTKFRQAEIQQLLSSQELDLEYNRLTNSLLEILKTDTFATDSAHTPADLQDDYLLALKRVNIVRLLFDEAGRDENHTQQQVGKLTGGGRGKHTNQVLKELETAGWATRVVADKKTVWKMTEEGKKMLYRIGRA